MMHPNVFVCMSNSRGCVSKCRVGQPVMFSCHAQAQANPKKWSKRKKAAYSGGLVLDPKRGLYDTHIMVSAGVQV